jgi:hypothetical protein
MYSNHSQSPLYSDEQCVKFELSVPASGWKIRYNEHPGGRYHLVGIWVPHAERSSCANYGRKLPEYRLEPGAAGNGGRANLEIHLEAVSE